MTREMTFCPPLSTIALMGALAFLTNACAFVPLYMDRSKAKDLEAVFFLDTVHGPGKELLGNRLRVRLGKKEESKQPVRVVLQERMESDYLVMDREKPYVRNYVLMASVEVGGKQYPLKASVLSEESVDVVEDYLSVKEVRVIAIEVLEEKILKLLRFLLGERDNEDS